MKHPAMLSRLVLGLLFSVLSGMAWGQTNTYLWPTILFVKGQDLCQFDEAYGSGRAEQLNDMTRHLKDLMRFGATTTEGVDALLNLDAAIDRHRNQATTGARLDVTLEASLRANLDRMYLGFNQKDVRLQFFNPGPLGELVKNLRDNRRQDNLDIQQLSVLSGIAWGTYAYGPGCKGDLLVTLHIELVTGRTVSFQAQGKPETVMSHIAADVVRYFQRTSFPTVVMMGDKSLILVGTAGNPVNSAPTPSIAEKSCLLIKARLPTLEEYEFLSIKGDWNNGVSLDHKLWALSGNRVLNPDTRNPSPVRSHAETNFGIVNFYCVNG